MNRQLIGRLGVLMCWLLVATSAQATLLSRLGGAATYDTVLDITWLTNAGLSGSRTWDEQVAWAGALDTLGFDDWRLASMSVSAGVPTGTAGSVVDCSSATELACRDHELGYMFYQNLGGTLGANLKGSQTVGNVTLSSIQSNYWSGTEFGGTSAWRFGFINSAQDFDGKNLRLAGWAVRSGDVATVPEPTTLVLMGAGLGLLGVS